MDTQRTPAKHSRTRLDDVGFGVCLTTLVLALVGFAAVSALGDEARRPSFAASTDRPVAAAVG